MNAIVNNLNSLEFANACGEVWLHYSIRLSYCQTTRFFFNAPNNPVSGILRVCRRRRVRVSTISSSHHVYPWYIELLEDAQGSKVFSERIYRPLTSRSHVAVFSSAPTAVSDTLLNNDVMRLQGLTTISILTRATRESTPYTPL